MKTPKDVVQANVITHLIKSLLEGYKSEVRGLVLADLMAMWLAGHIIANDSAGSKRVRERLLEKHIEAVKKLTEIYADQARKEQIDVGPKT